MKKGFSILQRVGRAFMLPIAVLPMAGILLGVGGAFTSKAVIDTYHLTFLEPGTVIKYLFYFLTQVHLFLQIFQLYLLLELLLDLLIKIKKQQLYLDY